MSTTLRRAFCFLISLAVLSSIASCDFGGNDGNNTPDTLIPLTEGNRWVAEVSGGATDSVTTEVVGDSVRVKKHQGGIVVILDVLLSEQSDGLLLRGAGLSNVMLLKFPVEDGSTYEHTDANGNTYQVSVSRTSASVPVGNFENCLEYAVRGTENGTLRAILTVKPGFGPVRWSSDIFPITDQRPAEITSTNVNR
jgi:hypothetical protein